MKRGTRPSRLQRQFWFLPLVPGVLILLGAWLYGEYVRWGLTGAELRYFCDVCPEDGLYFVGLYLVLPGILASIVLFIGGGADRDDRHCNKG
jgi:hypothetical protein